MAQSPAPAYESRPPNATSWLDLKWNNPENTNRFAKTSRTVNCRRCGRSCKRNANCSLCIKRWGKVSKVYPKLSVKTTEKPSEVEAAGSGANDDSRKYRQHWWRCNGPCRDKMPYLGVIRRSINRPPGPTDKWWSDHVKTCGGTFIKQGNPKVPETKKRNIAKNGDIRNFLSVSRCSGTSDSSAISSDVSGSTLETDVSFELEEDDDLSNRLLEICDGVETKLQCDRSCRSEEERIRKSDKDDEDILFQSDGDEVFNNTLLETCEDVEAKLEAQSTNEAELVPCVACGVQLLKTQLDSHLAACINDIFEVEVEDGAKEDSQFSCPLCLKSIGESDLKEHVEVCSSAADSAILFSDE